MRRWLRGTLRVVFLMALLGALNLYVLYYRRGPSVPELLRAAEVGRKATFMPGMEGPPGTPPKMAAKRPDLEGGLRPEYLRVVEVALHVAHGFHYAQLLLFKLRLFNEAIGHRCDKVFQLVDLFIDDGQVFCVIKPIGSGHAVCCLLTPQS